MHPHTHKKGGSESRYSTNFFGPPTEAGAQTAHWQMLNTESNLEKLLDTLKAESNHINQEFDHFDQ